MLGKSIAGLSFGLLLLAAAPATPARADVLYPWCAMYAGGSKGIGATICTYNTVEQCMETVRGLGGYCQPNPAYPDTTGSGDAAKRRR